MKRTWAAVEISILALLLSCAPSSVTNATPGASPAPSSEPAIGADVAVVPADATFIDVGTSIQWMIDRRPAGTTYVLRSGVHREQAFTPKPGDVFIAEEGAVLSGARELIGFERSGDLWVIGGQTQEGTVAERIAYNGQDICIEPSTNVLTPRCQHPETLFMDDHLLLQVDTLAAVGPGSWYFDYDANEIYIGDDPSGSVVETSVVPQAIVALGSDSVTLVNLIVEKYATPAQDAAVQTGIAWNIVGGEIRYNSAIGIRLTDSSTMRDTRVHHNGQLGVSAIGSGIAIERVEIDNNNTGGFSSFLIGGGTKFTRTVGLVVRDSSVHDNKGAGLSADYNNIDLLYVGNRITDNAGPGIHHEASFAAEFRDNWIENNGHERTSWVLGAGIFVNSSRNVTITQNTVINNYQGVIAVQVTRSDGQVSEYGPHEIANFRVFGNRIEMPQGQTGIAIAGGVIDPERFYEEIVFYDNIYALGQQTHPFRIGEGVTVDEWRTATLADGAQFVSLP